MVKETSGIRYQVEECEHPVYAAMSVNDLMKVINIDEGEVPPLAYKIMIIIKPLHIPISICEDIVMKNEGIVDRADVIFE